MPNLRLTDQEAMNLVEHLLAQKRDTVKTFDTSKPVPEGEKPKEIADAWAAGLGPVDSGKLIELTAFFLRSRYSVQTATRKADDVTELKSLAIDALTSPVNDVEAAKAEVEAILQGKGGPTTRPMVALARPILGRRRRRGRRAVRLPSLRRRHPRWLPRRPSRRRTSCG